MFVSQLSKSIFNSSSKFEPIAIHFKVGSEHTIDNQRFDGELQIYFSPLRDPKDDLEDKTTNSPEIKQAVLCILLSTELSLEKKTMMRAELKAINSFFSQFKWEKEAVDDANVRKLDRFNVSDMLQRLNLDNRWVYQGSDNRPPCDQAVLWNVLSTVYPVDKLFIDKYVANVLSRSHQKTLKDPRSPKAFAFERDERFELETTGNWRYP